MIVFKEIFKGRVTERTEPMASTSTVMSTGITLPNNTITDSKDDILVETGEEPKDFDTFYQELNSTNAIIPGKFQCDDISIVTSHFVRVPSFE